MTVKLRAHHLLCLLTYVGKGYSPAFTANYDKVVKRLGEGEAVVIVAGPDDVCAPLLGEPEPHCLRESAAERDRMAARDVGALLGRPIRAGDRLVLDAHKLAGMRKAFSAGLTRQACSGCEWSGLCDTVAASGFSDTYL
ncbi:DUF1284 domain-containing protein [Mesorhizobium sp. CA18]|uniref:DUF1284 domain-containing protein n=1 Tax=unclassified Mesorhizobium TaxID=325217 RepID=UPI001CCDBEDA|nr:MULTISPECIES: DUF1284 domain-containing protein [unclassified Mesorhizobium]MBZ9733189.1 DUF1284 domain-containing protein [Mesorhizobium sp. CA9]MBZ9826023.1 DUF1284 domain-containing protein [Mesorhizobium sp. CA18]MBZ9831024.1 DUF1284 domain-containing protein [Mesorhizobium sp. CA2]MBZ9835301.1 DUF1284 domain-containing protein [Mesorhizobium sp. CA3]MBZ9876015.1 DUF1284 domain-containing protein [Mesorhizobium sp. Ca11]